jgi:transketolase
MRKASLDAVHEMARSDPRICFIGSDLTAGTLKAMQTEMPERFFMEGVSEQHIIGMSAGLAMSGKIVYVNTIATFLTRRCFEQLVDDLCLHGAKVRLIANGGGLVYAPLGPTHLAIEDLAILRSIPNMTVVAPCDAQEMRRLVIQSVDWPGPIYFRVAKGGEPVVSRADLPSTIGKAIVLSEGKDVLLVTTGIMLHEALQAAKTLAQRGISAGILHLHSIKPLDRDALVKAIARVPAVISIEEHTICGGLGSAIAEVIAETDFPTSKRFRRLGIPDLFPNRYGSQQSLMESFQIDAAGIIRAVEELMGRHMRLSAAR